MTGMRTRAVALAMVLAMVLAACGGGDSETETGADAASTDPTDTTEVAESGDAGDADDPAASDPVDGSGTDGGAAVDPAAPTPAAGADAPSGGATDPAAAPAAGGGQSAAGAKPADDAAALARALRVEDLPTGYQQHEETKGEDEEQAEFEESFRRCMKAAGANPDALGEPTGEASRSFGKGPANPQNPEGISSGVGAFADAGATERMIAELGTLFNSEPGRVCIEQEIQKAVAAEAATAAPGATFEVDAQALSAYKAANGIAQLRLEITVNFGAQKVVFYSDLIVVRAGNFASILSFTQSNSAFDPKVGQPIVDKAVARLSS